MDTPHPIATDPSPRLLHLVIDDSLYAMISGRIPLGYDVTRRSELDPEVLVGELGIGDSLVWIAAPDGLPDDLWCGAFRPAGDAFLDACVRDDSPVPLGDLAFRPSRLSSACIKPVHEPPMHNAHEEIRADFLPILDAKDAFGQTVGYPGVLISHFAPSLVGRRFDGTQCYLFLFDSPADALSGDDWVRLLCSIRARFRSGVQIRRVETEYASYKPSERVRVRVRVANHGPSARAVELRFFLKLPDDTEFRGIASHRRCPEGGCESEAVCDLPVGGNPGMWTVRVEAFQDVERAEHLAVVGEPVCVDRREIGFVVIDGLVRTPATLEVDGPSIRIDGRDGFWAGTHYYPSSSWWEWVWRDFKPLLADRDFAGIRRAGYRIARIWIDPVVDEQTMRGVEAAIQLASRHGITLIVCVFTQWPREISFERPDGEMTTFTFREVADVNLYSVSLRHMDLQREYVRTMAERWRNAGNIIWDLSNEACVKDPDPSQMDEEVRRWEGIPAENGTYRDSMLFRRWAAELTSVIRECGCEQIVLPGYMFSIYDGGDTHIGNRDSAIVPWHCYEPGLTGPTLVYFDAACTDRPTILEEFGFRGWNCAGHYDEGAHLALATGASAAMSYEWGVSWLAPDSCFHPLPLREYPDGEPDPRRFMPFTGYKEGWPSTGVGLCPTPSGFGYGSIYHGTPFPADAAKRLGRLGLMGRGLSRAARDESVYLLIRTAKNDSMEAYYSAIRHLWRTRVPFGVRHEDCLPSLPGSARLLICPDGVSPESESLLAILRTSGVEISVGPDMEWTNSPALRPIDLSPSDGIDLLVRRTRTGTLYTLIAETTGPSVRLTSESGCRVSMDVQDYAMIHDIHDTGITFVEASGDVTIDGARLCTVSSGRAIISSEDWSSLPTCPSIRLAATGPATITFARLVRYVDLFMEGAEESIGRVTVDSEALRVDEQMSAYVLRVVFADQC